MKTWTAKLKWLDVAVFMFKKWPRDGYDSRISVV